MSEPARYFEDPEHAPRNHLLVSSVRVVHDHGHDRVSVWNRGGLSGELVMNEGDGEQLAERLGLIEVPGSMVGSAAAIHILRQGYALCGFHDDTPNCWPPGHKWVSVTDPDDATCTECQRAQAQPAGQHG